MDIKNFNVLIVEDEELVLKQIKIILEDYIDNIFTAKNGVEALEIIQNNHIDILISDILMPIMDGIELISEIRNKNLNVSTVIITTAHSETEYLLSAIKLRVDGYLMKPINAIELIEIIQKSIRLKTQESEIWLKNRILDSISIFVGGKKIEIIKYLFEHADKENIFRGSYQDIMDALNISKPTLVATFKQLIEIGIVTKIKNKVYKINTSDRDS